MKLTYLSYLTILIAILFIISCDIDVVEKEAVRTDIYDDEIAFSWTLDTINPAGGYSIITQKITNNGSSTLSDDWAIYFNQIQVGMDKSTFSEQVTIDRLSGTFFALRPTAEFQPLSLGSSFEFTYKLNALILRESDGPVGIYIVKNEEKPKLIRQLTINGIDESTLAGLPLENPTGRFDENSKYKSADMALPEQIVPTPKEIAMDASYRMMTLGDEIVVSTNDELGKEVNWLKALLSHSYNGAIANGRNGDIQLTINETNNEPTGSYDLRIDDNGVHLSSGTRIGIFNGISTLVQLIHSDYYTNPNNQIRLPYVAIQDHPSYGYRGIMLDVCRFFHSVESVKKLLDLMAFYKLNNFHFHLGDDEGWRLEIPGIPELTEYGGKRGHTLDESDFLQPAYGSGPFVEDSYGSGWYTREEYIDIVAYAAARHIEVIPEMDMPGHSRAAIKAMNARYRKHMKSGNKEEAEKYLLSDPSDESVYNSAQGYGDNSFCVCRESTYDFVEKVLDEIVAMHKEAGAPLKTFHSGGDEVAYGSWQKSPICQNFIKANTESVSHTDDLQSHFTKRYKSIIDKHGLTTAGWEEYVLKNSSEGHHGKQLNPEFIGENMRPYVWNATWGWGREDMAYKLANAGYEVVICNSAQLYFDMAYNMDPKENGLMWTGMVDTKNPFFLIPEDIYSMPYKKNNRGVPVSDDLFEDHVRLTERGKGNLLGIQGHLWSETISNADRIEYYLFPKSIGLAERAWNANPDWASVDAKEKRIRAMETAWGRFSQKVGEHHFPMLDQLFDGVGYRIPLPGAKVEDNVLYTNIRFPGLMIRYTTDGSEPTSTSAEYKAPVALTSDIEVVKVKAYTTNGRASRSSVLNLE